MVSRQGRSLNLPFPELVDELHELPDGIVLGGELVVLDAFGRSQFEAAGRSAIACRMTRRRIMKARAQSCSNCGCPRSSTTTSPPSITVSSDKARSSSTSSGNGRLRLRPRLEHIRTKPLNFEARQWKRSCFISKIQPG